MERRRDGRKTGFGGGSKSSTTAKSQDKEILFRVRGEMTMQRKNRGDSEGTFQPRGAKWVGVGRRRH